jgi:hypothetical protein
MRIRTAGHDHKKESLDIGLLGLACFLRVSPPEYSGRGQCVAYVRGMKYGKRSEAGEERALGTAERRLGEIDNSMNIARCRFPLMLFLILIVSCQSGKTISFLQCLGPRNSCFAFVDCKNVSFPVCDESLAELLRTMLEKATPNNRHDLKLSCGAVTLRPYNDIDCNNEVRIVMMLDGSFVLVSDYVPYGSPTAAAFMNRITAALPSAEVCTPISRERCR